MRSVAVLLVGLCTGLASAGKHAAAQEWTRFRGPNGSGVSEVTTVPVKWGDADYNWKIELPGRGHSSPVLWGTRLFITSAAQESGKRYVLCIDTADGRAVWTHELEFDAHKKHRNNTHTFILGYQVRDAGFKISNVIIIATSTLGENNHTITGLQGRRHNSNRIVFRGNFCSGYWQNIEQSS